MNASRLASPYPLNALDADIDCNIAASRMQRRIHWHDILSALGETETARLMATETMPRKDAKP